MDFCDASSLLRNRTITDIYCINDVLDDVTGFLATGSTETPVDMLTTATPVSIDNVFKLQLTTTENVYEAEEGIEGITDVHVYDTATGDEILPVDGKYTITGTDVHLSYNVDGINLIDYTTSLDKTVPSAITDINTDHLTSATYYTLSGIRVTEPVSGVIYICRSNDGTARKVIY